MLKLIRLGPGVLLASEIAWRSDPAPESALLVTTSVPAVQLAAQNNHSANTRIFIPKNTLEEPRHCPGFRAKWQALIGSVAYPSVPFQSGEKNRLDLFAL